jgi:positive regulator of sigma E activity
LALSLFFFPILEREENRRIVFLAVCLLFLFLILERERERIKRKRTQQSNSLLRGISKRNAAM